MQRFILQFQTPQDLTGFRKMVKDRVLFMNLKELILECTCTAEEIIHAQRHYAGVVLSKVDNG